MKKIFLVLFLLLILFSFPIIILTGFVFFQFFMGDTSHLQKDRILGILSKETVLYYDDDDTQLGSLFGQEHRLYVPIYNVPQIVKESVIVAEDSDFYNHFSIDFKGTFRAVIKNLFLNKREGASTITQQTVKNIYGRASTNIFTKFSELINALKLEKIYTKDQILEFYLNQFYVTGNGRGIGIAAKYYFNKNVEALDLVEAAFIAGSLKAPEKYNPFSKKSPEKALEAKKAAKLRKNYVLDRLFEDNKITKEQYLIALQSEVPFKQGKFQFNDLFINHLIERQLSKKDILDALEIDNVREAERMGLRITTTLKKEVQEASLYALRRNLSRLEMILGGFSPASQNSFSVVSTPILYAFYTGRISKITQEKGKDSIEISFTNSSCLIPPDGVDRVAAFLDFGRGYGIPAVKKKLLNTLKPDDYVLVSIRDIGQEKTEKEIFCDLEVQPRIQGGLLALDQGRIVGVAGGFSPYEYNRAVFAKRQSGSAFKSLIYYASQQLGWSISEPLPDIRDVYTWQGLYYYPNPDHPTVGLTTSMVAAGAKSENLASIWLLKHLLDKISYEKFMELLEFLDVVQPNKTEAENLRFIGSKFNVYANSPSQIKMGLLEKMKSELLVSSLFPASNNSKILIQTIHYGEGFPAEEKNIEGDTSLSEEKKNVRKNMLKNNLLRWQSIYTELFTRFQTIKKSLDAGQKLSELDMEVLSHFIYTKEGIGHLSLKPWIPQSISRFAEEVPTKRLSLEEAKNFVRSAAGNSDKFDSLLLDGVFPVKAIKYIAAQLDKSYQALSEAPPFLKLYWNDDLKYSLGMYYVNRMIKAMGVQSETDWVPSMPLGAGDITLAELALMYQTMLTGKIYHYFNNGDANQIVLIKKIEDSHGNLLWEAVSKESELISEFYSAPMLSILRAVVTNGTAAGFLKGKITVPGKGSEPNSIARIEIPVFGKTGTTNENVNGVYVGFLPYGNANNTKEFSREHMYTIATYVGYDNNEPMVKNGIKIYGGFGAIPAWAEVATAITRGQSYRHSLNAQAVINEGLSVVPVRYGAHNYYARFFGGSLSETFTEETPLPVFVNAEEMDGKYYPKTPIQFFIKDAGKSKKKEEPVLSKKSEEDTVSKETEEMKKNLEKDVQTKENQKEDSPMESGKSPSSTENE